MTDEPTPDRIWLNGTEYVRADLVAAGLLPALKAACRMLELSGSNQSATVAKALADIRALIARVEGGAP